MGPSAWDQGSSRKHLLDAIDTSLRRLGTDYIDLYQLHIDDAGVGQAARKQRLGFVDAGPEKDSVLLGIQPGAKRLGQVRMMS